MTIRARAVAGPGFDATGWNEPMHAFSFAREMVLAGSAALAISLAAAPSVAMTLGISESQIASLANAPALLALQPMADEAGKPSLRLELEFANDCYAETGAETELLAKPDGEGAVLVLSQRVPPDGCPEIFQPTRRTLGLRLPAELAGQRLYVVARPGPEGGVRSVLLADAAGGPLAADEIRDAALSPSFAPTMTSVSLTPSGATGYAVTGSLQVRDACAESDVQARVFEVPDKEGTPRSDVVLIAAPARCMPAEAGAGTNVSLRIDTPQPRRGRTFVLLNATPPMAMPLL
jgi:hypothetical protein